MDFTYAFGQLALEQKVGEFDRVILVRNWILQPSDNAAEFQKVIDAFLKEFAQTHECIHRKYANRVEK